MPRFNGMKDSKLYMVNYFMLYLVNIVKFSRFTVAVSMSNPNTH